MVVRVGVTVIALFARLYDAITASRRPLAARTASIRVIWIEGYSGVLAIVALLGAVNDPIAAERAVRAIGVTSVIRPCIVARTQVAFLVPGYNAATTG